MSKLDIFETNPSKRSPQEDHMAAQYDDIEDESNSDNLDSKSALNGPAFRCLLEHQRREDELWLPRSAEGFGAGSARTVEQAHEPETPPFDQTSDSPASRCQPLLKPQPLDEVPATPPHSSEVPPPPPNSPSRSASASGAALPVHVSLIIARAFLALGRNGRDCSHGKCARKRDLPYHARVIKTAQFGSTRSRNSRSNQGKEGLRKIDLADQEPCHERFFVEPHALRYNQNSDSRSEITTFSFTDGPLSNAGNDNSVTSTPSKTLRNILHDY